MKLTMLALVVLAATAAGARADISLRTSATTSATGGGSETITLPAGTGEGDFMLAFVMVEKRNASQLSSPGGWTVAQSDDTSNHTQVVYWRVATAADVASAGTSWTWSWAGNREHIVSLLVFRGVDPVNPVNDAAGSNFSDKSTSVTMPSLTPAVANTMLVASANINRGTSFSWTAPMAVVTDVASGGGGGNLTQTTAIEAWSAASATGTRTATADQSDNRRIGQMIALAPATVPGPALRWRMDEGAWNGAAGEVKDASGNGLDGTASGGAGTATTTATNAKYCRSGQFAGGSTQYVQVADNPLLDIDDRITVTAWVRPASWPGGGLMTIASKDTNYEFHIDSGGHLYWWWSGGANAITSASTIPANVWTHVAIVFTRGAQEIYINGVRDADNWTNPDRNLTATNSLPFQVGNDQGFAGRYFNGLIDEVRVYHYTMSAADVQNVYDDVPSPLCAVSLTHYAISLPGGSTGLTCESSQVTVAGHDSGHAEVAPAAGTVLNLSTSTGAGAWVAGLVDGSGTWTPSGASDGRATYVWPGGETSFTVRLRQNTPATINVNLIDGGGLNEAASEDPSIDFKDTAFRVTADGVNPATIGTQIAGKPSNTGFGAQTRYLQAMRTDTNTGACTTVFQNQSVSVGLAGARVNPGGGASALSVRNSGGAMQAIATGAGGPGAYSSVSLAFDAQSKAPLVLSYPDAGSVQLYASYALPSPPAGTTMTGSSNAFVVRPFGLRVSGPTTAATPSPSSPAFAKAGADFNVTLTAVAWKAGDDANADGVPDSDAQIAANAATPNFDAAATLSHSLNAPAGGNAGTLGGSTSFSGFSAGAKTQSVNWSEVGFIDLHATSANYLGSGQSVSNSAAGLTGVGRFRPDHFALSGGTLTNRAAAGCAPASAFSYLGEGMRLQFTLTAQNTANATTQNYSTASGFAKLPTVPAGMGFGAVNGTTNLGSRLDLGNSGALSWSAGAASVDYTLAVDRASPDNPDGPFGAARIGIAPSDGDGVTLAGSAYDMDVDNNAVNEHKQIGANTQLRFGRIAMDNALGPDGVAVPVPLTAEYWNGATFATNTLDSCTRIPRGAIILDSYDGALAPGGGNCKTYVEQNPVAIGAGVGTLTLAAPPAGTAGSVRLTPNLGTVAAGNSCASSAGGETPAAAAVLPYLQGRWNDTLNPDGIGSTMYDDNPSARAAFGLYGSQPDNLIFLRERY